MSLLEVLIAVSGLGIGYWLVSVFLSNSPSPIDPAQGHEPHEVDIGARPWTEVLGVDADADEAAITAAYRRRIAEYRPDRVATMAEEIRARVRALGVDYGQGFAIARPVPITEVLDVLPVLAAATTGTYLLDEATRGTGS